MGHPKNRYCWSRFAAAAVVGMWVCLSMGAASAQVTPADIRAVLGGPIDLEEAALFAATRTSYKHLCDGEPWAEFHASIINRLNYGSLDESEKKIFVEFYGMQIRSNARLFEGFDVVAKRFFCEGLDETVTSMAANFLDNHPNVFEETLNQSNEGEIPLEDTRRIGMSHTPNVVIFRERSQLPESNQEITVDEVEEPEVKNPDYLIQMPSVVTRKTTQPGFVSIGEKDLLQAEAEQQGFAQTVGDAFTNGGNILYQTIGAIGRKMESGPRDENWAGNVESVQDNWIKNRKINPYDEWRFRATRNQQEAEMLLDTQIKNEERQASNARSDGFGTFTAHIIVRFFDSITFFLTFFIVAVFVRAPIVTIAIIGAIAGPLLLRAFASLGDADVTGYRIAVASIVGIMHALIAIRMMSARRQKAMAATEARLAGGR